jgi:hypothetical protein
MNPNFLNLFMKKLTRDLAWERVRQAGACRNGGYRLNGRIEARTLFCPAQETVETDTEGKAVTWRTVERESHSLPSAPARRKAPQRRAG